MKEKLLAALAKAKELVGKAYALSPFGFGLACGYLGSPVIKLAIDLAVKLIKFLVNLI